MCFTGYMMRSPSCTMHTQMDVQTHDRSHPEGTTAAVMPGPAMRTCPDCIGSGMSESYDFCDSCGGIGEVPR